MESSNGINSVKFNLFEEKLQHSLSVLNKAFDEYNLNEIFLSFNGGKDCTVLLHLAFTLLKSRLKSQYTKLLCIYLKPEHSFEEIELFVNECNSKYFPIVVQPGMESKQAALFNICNEYPTIKACLMGSRRTDPYCQDLHDFEMTTKGWPALMRINPLLDWTCDDIWKYLKMYNVPYCSLYDVGYTSLGDKTNTRPNPHLKRLNTDTGKEEYGPAYELKNADVLERVGRFFNTQNGS